MSTSRRLLAVLFAFCGIASAADRALLDLMMPDAQVLFGINVARIAESSIGKEIKAGLQGASPELQQIVQQTGFDPARDLQEILIAATGNQNGEGLILARGNFDAAKLGAFCSRSSRPPVKYEGVDILSSPTPHGGAFAFVDNTIAIGGTLGEVKAAIRRHKQQVELNPNLIAKVASTSERYDIWVLSTQSMAGIGSKLSDTNRQLGDLVKSIEQVTGGVKFSSNLDAALELITDTEQNAIRVHDTLSLFTGFLTPGRQEASGIRPEDIKLTVESKTVRLKLTITGEQLQKQVQMARNGMGARISTAAPARPKPSDDLVIQSSERDMGTVKVPAGNKD